MRREAQSRVRYVAAAAMLALPVLLLFSSYRTLGELQAAKSSYLRSRAATLAARLESLPADELRDGRFDTLYVEEPALVDLVVFSDPARADNPVLATLWNGGSLFHTETIRREGMELLRVWVPFRSAGSLQIARMELDREAADYLVRHTRRHLAVSFAASLALVSFTLYFLWSERRAIRLERRQYELEHLAQLGKMAAVLAHEIRNPLGTIKGFVQLALEKADAAVAGLLGPVTGETARLEKLVSDLLAYGRPRNPERRRVSWEEIASQVEIHAAEAIAGRGVRFVREGSLDGIETDPDLLGQVLLTLVRNSVEAVEQEADGEVRLAAESGGNGYLITVEDNGPGLPAEVRERLFEPFFTTKANGTGLGLSIARKLTEALGGRLEIGDRQPRGTKARLVFE